jgi:polar amino acid transport system ATP-binding protein
VSQVGQLSQAGQGSVVSLTAISKDYRGLRPLRIQELIVRAGERVALLGFDQPSAEVFVNLLTGAAVPDTGSVLLFGRPTENIADAAEWLAIVDRFGIVSERAVLLEQLTIIQNLALPFTLDIEPPAADVRDKAAMLASEVGLAAEGLGQRVSELDAGGRARVRLGRALALNPAVLLLEHVNAGVPPAASDRLARDIGELAGTRGTAVIAITADERFAEDVAGRVLRLEPATGRLVERRRGWFRRR